MSKVTYEEFYFRPINDNLDFEVIERYFKEHNSRGKYDKQMFCPDCRIPELKFTPEGKTHQAYLSAINADLHLPGCAHRYDVSPTRNTKTYFESLSDEQVEDKLASILRTLNRMGNYNRNIHTNYLQHPDRNPFILEFDDNGTNRIQRSLPRRNLNKSLKKEDVDLLCAFYARGASLSIKADKHTNNQGKEYEIYYLHIETTNGKQYRIYRGAHKDEVFPNRGYDVVLIGSFSEKALDYSIQYIDLIKRNIANENKPNQYAIVIQ